MNPRLLLLPGLVALVAVVLWRSYSEPSAAGIPAGTWRIGLGTDVRQARNYDELPAESPIRLAWSCDEPRFVYVFGHSAEDGTLLMFPSPDVRGGLANPLPAGSSVLPGTCDGKELAWTSRSGTLATTTIVAIAAREKIPELEALLPRLRRWSNSVLTDRSMQVTNPTDGTAVTAGPRTGLPDPLLQRAADTSITATIPNGPLQPDPTRPGVWIGSWKFVEKKAAPKKS